MPKAHTCAISLTLVGARRYATAHTLVEFQRRAHVSRWCVRAHAGFYLVTVQPQQRALVVRHVTIVQRHGRTVEPMPHTLSRAQCLYAQVLGSGCCLALISARP